MTGSGEQCKQLSRSEPAWNRLHGRHIAEYPRKSRVEWRLGEKNKIKCCKQQYRRPGQFSNGHISSKWTSTLKSYLQHLINIGPQRCYSQCPASCRSSWPARCAPWCSGTGTCWGAPRPGRCARRSAESAGHCAASWEEDARLCGYLNTSNNFQVVGVLTMQITGRTLPFLSCTITMEHEMYFVFDINCIH